MDMVNTEKTKEKQEVQLQNYQQISLPCLRKNGRKKKKKEKKRMRGKKINNKKSMKTT